MSFAQRAQASLSRLVGHYGGEATVTVRRTGTLKNKSTGAVLTTLAVRGAFSTGAAAIDLDALNLQGRLVANATLTIAGDAQIYTVTADNEASAAGVLSGVAISPTLQQNAADDAVVTVTARSATYSFRAAVYGYRDDEIDAEAIKSGDRQVVLPAVGTPIVPQDDDQVTVGGELVDILEIRRMKPGDVRIGDVLHVRGRTAA